MQGVGARSSVAHTCINSRLFPLFSLCPVAVTMCGIPYPPAPPAPLKALLAGIQWAGSLPGAEPNAETGGL